MESEEELLTGGLRILREYGVPIEFCELEPQDSMGARYAPDARAVLTVNGRTCSIDVVCKKGLRPSDPGLIAAHATEPNRRLLVADHVSRPMAERLRNLGIMFVDMAGNAWVDIPPVVIRVEGRKAVERLQPARPNRAFQPTGLRVVFTLLCRPELFRAPLRDIAAATGVSHGTAGWIMRGLREAGYLIERGKGRGRRRNPRNLVRLLDDWAAAYAHTLRPTLLLGRFAPGPRTPRNWWQHLDLEAHGLLLGAEPAAAELTDYLQPGTITLYAERLPGRVIAEQRLTRDDQGSIEFRHRFWPTQQDTDRPKLVPAVLIYADLLTTDDPRCIDTARMIHERYLAGPLGQS